MFRLESRLKRKFLGFGLGTHDPLDSDSHLTKSRQSIHNQIFYQTFLLILPISTWLRMPESLIGIAFEVPPCGQNKHHFLLANKSMISSSNGIRSIPHVNVSVLIPTNNRASHCVPTFNSAYIVYNGVIIGHYGI